MMLNTCETNINFQRALTRLNEKLGKKPYINNEANIKLSEIEYKILFLLFLGQTCKEISQTITKLASKTLSSSTVLHIIQRLQRKFNVTTTSKLMEKAVMLNLLTVPDEVVY